MIRRFSPLWLALGTLLLALFCLGAGRYAVSPQHVLSILLGPWFSDGAAITPLERSVVEGIRLPRVLLAAFVGAGLAGAGAALQSLLRNPLAEPQLLGVSSGAAFGGVLAFLLVGDGWPVVAGAFVFGMLALVMVFWLATGASRQPSNSVLLVLAGIVVSAVFAAGVSLTKLLADPQNQLPAIVFWLMGSLGGGRWSAVMLIAGVVALGSTAALAWARPLNAIALGEAQAALLGVNVERTKRAAILITALMVGAVTATTGIIGFVGLIAPHWVRLVAGPDHRVVLPGAALLGAALVLAADAVARTVVQPAELPLGVLTAAIGGPMFLWMLRRFRSRV